MVGLNLVENQDVDIPLHTPYNAIEYAFYSGGVEEAHGRSVTFTGGFNSRRSL